MFSKNNMHVVSFGGKVLMYSTWLIKILFKMIATFTIDKK